MARLLTPIVRLGIRTRFRVYRQYPLRDQLRILLNVASQGHSSRPQRIRKALNSVDTRNGILQDEAEWKQAERVLLEAGLAPHWDRAKNWDFAKALALLLRETEASDRILDAGCGRYSVPLEWLEAAGYRDLAACDYELDHKGRVGPIEYRVADLTQSPYADGEFAAALCLSVIEHNVDLDSFYAEMGRILKPQGLLVLSTDYWPDKIDTRGVRPYGDALGDTKIFSRPELEDAVRRAQDAGFRPLTPMRYEAKERVIQWRIVKDRYTFAFLALRKA